MLLPDDETVLNTKFHVVILKTAACRFWTPPPDTTTRHHQTYKLATICIGNLITLYCAQVITYAHYVRERCNGGAYGARNVQIYYHNRFAIWIKPGKTWKLEFLVVVSAIKNLENGFWKPGKYTLKPWKKLKQTPWKGWEPWIWSGKHGDRNLEITL